MNRQALRDNLRLAATVTLVNGFSSLATRLNWAANG
jgi:hypothetical protein